MVVAVLAAASTDPQGLGVRRGERVYNDSMRIYESKNFALHHESGSCRTNGHQYIYI